MHNRVSTGDYAFNGRGSSNEEDPSKRANHRIYVRHQADDQHDAAMKVSAGYLAFPGKRAHRWGLDFERRLLVIQLRGELHFLVANWSKLRIATELDRDLCQLLAIQDGVGDRTLIYYA